MEKLILGIISTLITPFVIWYSFQERRKYETDYRRSKKLSPETDRDSGGLNVLGLLGGVFTFILGLYLLYEYFFLS
ncbi:hypothetical protein [Gracilimonas sp.]|uniref:hypothetical protein n=1 Tax=Gracilimonas sp. TaxID=1974203 RepID=UPI0025C1AB7E|nr:hypothetical protein [Gracilimonas sp.]